MARQETPGPPADLIAPHVTREDLGGLRLMPLDVMVTSDSAPVHPAGALGVPTWLAPSSVAEWHWIAGREDSPWNPTVRVFGQAGLND
jgi:hypothetical protein